MKAAEIAEDGEIAGADVPRVVEERLLQMLMEGVKLDLHYMGDIQTSKKLSKEYFCTSFCCIKRTIIIHLARNVIKDYSGGKIVGRKAQQELCLLEFLLGHVTYLSPEEQKNTFSLPSLNSEETTFKLHCEKKKK